MFFLTDKGFFIKKRRNFEVFVVLEGLRRKKKRENLGLEMENRKGYVWVGQERLGYDGSKNNEIGQIVISKNDFLEYF